MKSNILAVTSFRAALITTIALITTSCVTGPSTTVVERADGLSSPPKWTLFSEPQQSGDNKTRFIGYVEVDGESLKSAAFNMADEKAMSEPTKSLAEAFLDQNQVGEDLRVDGSYGRRVISATSGYRPPMPTLHIVRRYYEVVVVRTGVAGDQVRLRVWSQAEVTDADFAAAKRAYIRRLAGEPEVKKILDEIGRRQIEQVSAASTPKVTPVPQPTSASEAKPSDKNLVKETIAGDEK